MSSFKKCFLSVVSLVCISFPAFAIEIPGSVDIVFLEKSDRVNNDTLGRIGELHEYRSHVRKVSHDSNPQVLVFDSQKAEGVESIGGVLDHSREKFYKIRIDFKTVGIASLVKKNLIKKNAAFEFIINSDSFIKSNRHNNSNFYMYENVNSNSYMYENVNNLSGVKIRDNVLNTGMILTAWIDELIRNDELEFGNYHSLNHRFYDWFMGNGTFKTAETESQEMAEVEGSGDLGYMSEYERIKQE